MPQVTREDFLEAEYGHFQLPTKGSSTRQRELTIEGLWKSEETKSLFVGHLES